MKYNLDSDFLFFMFINEKNYTNYHDDTRKGDVDKIRKILDPFIEEPFIDLPIRPMKGDFLDVMSFIKSLVSSKDFEILEEFCYNEFSKVESLVISKETYTIHLEDDEE